MQKGNHLPNGRITKFPRQCIKTNTHRVEDSQGDRHTETEKAGLPTSARAPGDFSLGLPLGSANGINATEYRVDVAERLLVNFNRV